MNLKDKKNQQNNKTNDTISLRLEGLKRQIQETNPNITDDLLELLVEFVLTSMAAKM